jgi:probable phosphoglycerate mutase
VRDGEIWNAGWVSAVADARVVLVRHGETEWNREGRIQGYRGDSSLTATGHAQARLLAERLASECFDALHSSDAGRTRQTAAPIGVAAGLDVVYDAALRERNYGVFEGRTYLEVEREHPEAFQKFRSRDPYYVPPAGESAAQFRDRVVAALERIAAGAAGKHVAVIAHGGVLGMMHRHVTGTPLDAKRGYSLHNASINRLLYSGECWSIEVWGDVAHLPADSIDSVDKF